MKKIKTTLYSILFIIFSTVVLAGSGSLSLPDPLTLFNNLILKASKSGDGNFYHLIDAYIDIIDGTQSDQVRALNAQVTVEEPASSTGAGGNAPRGAHIAAVSNTTQTVQEISGLQTNAIAGVMGSSINVGQIQTATGQRVQVGCSTSGTCDIINGNGLFVSTPNGMLLGTREIQNWIGINVANAEVSGTINAWAIKTGTGKVEFGEEVTLNEIGTTPGAPSTSNQANFYVKNDKFIIQFDDAGTVRYKWLDLNGVGVLWMTSTTAP